MDARLVAWARAVKARQRGRALPVLWLFTDCERLPDPLPAIARLPKGLCGVVFRHDAMPERRRLACQVARACRGRRIVLTIAGDWRLAAALGVGVHLRGGESDRAPMGRNSIVTASAHDRKELAQAARRGAAVVFLSPIFRTSSHPDAAPLGAPRWAALAKASAVPVLALGGVSGVSARGLPRRTCRGAGAITALARPSLPWSDDASAGAAGLA